MATYKDKVTEADVISFDVFDTLLTRNVAHPADLFLVVKENFNQFSRFHLTADFTAMRRSAEGAAYEASLVAGHATLDDIYEGFKKAYGYGDEFSEELKRAEIQAEKEVLRANTRPKAIYDHAISSGKIVVAVSDMYLPKKVIADALKANGYDKFDEIIVSCHDKYSKHDGSAYAYLCNKYQGKKIVHFGDNKESDVNWAKAYGFDAVYLEQDLQVMSYEKTKASQAARGGKLLEISDMARYSVNDTQQSIITALITHKMVQPDMTELEAIGYGAFGPLLLGFVQWLHATAQKNHTDHLYFLARDGAIMQRAYEAYYGKRAIEHTYIFASRRLYNFASIRDQLTEEDVSYLTFADVSVKVRKYFEKYGIPVTHPVVAKALKQVKLDPNQLVPIHDGAILGKIKAAFVIASAAILDKSEKERLILQDYFRSVGLYNNAHAAVVDIGWWGRMQKSLNLLTEQQLPGYYFGVDNVNLTKKAGNLMEGFVDKRKPEDKLFFRIAKLGIEVVEYLFANPDQESVTAITKSGGTFKQSLRNGKKNESTLHADAALRVIQTAAINFIADFKDATKDWADSVKLIDRAVAFQEFDWLIREPSDQQAIVLGRVEHTFTEGLPPRSVGMPLHEASYYQIHPGALREEYKRSYWKQGFKKNVSIRQLDRYL